MADTVQDSDVRSLIVQRFREAVDAWNQGDLDAFLSVYLQNEFVTLYVDDYSIW